MAEYCVCICMYFLFIHRESCSSKIRTEHIFGPVQWPKRISEEAFFLTKLVIYHSDNLIVLFNRSLWFVIGSLLEFAFEYVLLCKRLRFLVPPLWTPFWVYFRIIMDSVMNETLMSPNTTFSPSNYPDKKSIIAAYKRAVSWHMHHIWRRRYTPSFAQSLLIFMEALLIIWSWLWLIFHDCNFQILHQTSLLHYRWDVKF